MCLVNTRKKWKSCCVCFVVLVISLGLIVTNFVLKDLRDVVEVEKCPACFGVTLCPAVMARSVKFTGLDSLASLLNSIGYKNVWFGTYENIKVVIKKLGSNWELQELDKKLCKNKGRSCTVSDAVSHVSDLTVIENFIRNGGVSDNFFLCPSTSGLSNLLQAVQLRNRGISLKTFLQNVWTILHINPEPLLLQILSKEDGWPVPAYYGSCGRVIVEEHVGETLTTYYSKPWIERAKLAHKLLVAAKKLTNDHPQFRFYLTDVSPDNIAVDASGSVYFIDLENVIVVDRNISDHDKPVTWTSPHVSEIYDCASCFTFSITEICSHQISDHNLYAVCQHLLSPNAVPGIMPGGLLHSIPHPVTEHYPNFSLILSQCGESVMPFGRFTVADQLLELLANIIQVHQILK